LRKLINRLQKSLYQTPMSNLEILL